MTKILLVEDDPNLGTILQDYLRVKGFEPELCRDGQQGLAVFQRQTYDLCLLDVMMPKMDGFELAKEIRQLNARVPIIFLTAKSMKEDTITGLKLGADDYLTKPFSMEELLLRIRAVLRRTQPPEPEQRLFTFGSFNFDYDQRLLTRGQASENLTSKEADLLKLLAQHVGQTVDRTHALKLIWKDDSYFNARSMDVYIAKLRKYLKPDESVQIFTVHGQGFKLIELTL